jgi:hypothetical protein
MLAYVVLVVVFALESVVLAQELVLVVVFGIPSIVLVFVLVGIVLAVLVTVLY